MINPLSTKVGHIMAYILSVGHAHLPHVLKQKEALDFAKSLFKNSFEDIDRLLNVFLNGQISERHFCMPLEWYEGEHSFEEKNNTYIKMATDFSVEAVKRCLTDDTFLETSINVEDIDAIFFISSTGISTPSIDAKIMNVLPFSPNTVRVPIWGLGCAGGTVGISRAKDYCLAYPKANVLVINAELCSLTFQPHDQTKSNIIGSSLFSDGVSCTLVVGEQSTLLQQKKQPILLQCLETSSTLMENSEDVMGWEVKNDGLYVIFSRSIPSIVKNWFKGNVEQFLKNKSLTIEDIDHFIAHPGGKKVLDAYEHAFNLSQDKTKISRTVLEKYGNMSSATVMFVLEQTLKAEIKKGDLALMCSLGPGFSSELALLKGVK
jgi:alkylresorcinol/alkylpyrone synthase